VATFFKITGQGSRSYASLVAGRSLFESRRARTAFLRARRDGLSEEPERDEDGLYIGTYSNFFSDPSQIKGVVGFCAVLLVFFVGGQILSGLLLPYLFGGAKGVHPDVTSVDYWTKF